MTLIATERIKFLSTRSPWWCMVLTLAVTVGFSVLVVGSTDDPAAVNVSMTQLGHQFGLAVILVLAALAVTTEYRFGTIRTTFQAVPNRAAALLAKTTVVAMAAGVIGLIAAFGSWGIATLVQPNADIAIDTAAEWRAVAGVSIVFAIAAVIAVAVGTLIRHTAGAVSILLTYALMGENLVRLIPRVGDGIHRWLPFSVADRFLMASPEGAKTRPWISSLDPWWALAYFAAFAGVLLVAAIVTARKRDA